MSALASDGTDVVCLRSLRAGPGLELDPLTFLELPITVRLDRRVVDEEVLATVIGRDEAETLRGVEELHGANCHVETTFLQVTPVWPTPRSVGTRRPARQSATKSTHCT